MDQKLLIRFSSTNQRDRYTLVKYLQQPFCVRLALFSYFINYLQANVSSHTGMYKYICVHRCYYHTLHSTVILLFIIAFRITTFLLHISLNTFVFLRGFICIGFYFKLKLNQAIGKRRQKNKIKKNAASEFFNRNLHCFLFSFIALNIDQKTTKVNKQPLRKKEIIIIKLTIYNVSKKMGIKAELNDELMVQSMTMKNESIG